MNKKVKKMLDKPISLCYNGIITIENPSTRDREPDVRKKNKPKLRNWLAIHAHFRTGSGNHGDKRKQKAKKGCRNFKWKG